MSYASLVFVLVVYIFHSTAYHNLFLNRNCRIINLYDQKNENIDQSRESNNSSSLVASQWWVSLISPKIERDIKSSTRYADYYIGRKFVKQAKNIVDNAGQVLNNIISVDKINVNQTGDYIKLLKLGVNPLENSKLLGNFDDNIQKSDKSNVYASLNTIIEKAKYDGQRIKRKMVRQSINKSNSSHNSVDSISFKESVNNENFNIESNIVQNDSLVVLESEEIVGNVIENLLEKVEILKLMKLQFGEILSICNEIIIKENLDAASSNYIYIQVFMDDIIDGIRAIDRILLIAIKRSVLNDSVVDSSDEEYIPRIDKIDVLDIYNAIESILMNYKTNSKNINDENLIKLSLIKVDDVVERDGILMKCYIPLYKILAGILNIDVTSNIRDLIKITGSLSNDTIDTTVATYLITSENVNSDELLIMLSKVSRDSLDIAAGLSVTGIKAITNIVNGFGKQALKRMKSNLYLNDPSLSVMVSDKNSTNRFRKEKWNLVGSLDADENEDIADLYDD